jgi:ABC-type transporter MlaC component
MSVPLDRLYNFLHDVVDHDITIYRFTPHGSKKLEDLLPLVPEFYNLAQQAITPEAIFHDQEPLNFDLWSSDNFVNYWEQNINKYAIDPRYAMPQWKNMAISLHLRGILWSRAPVTLYDYVFLVHSEKNSKEVDTYFQHGFLPVYYWSHAVIAADWFRYAEHDPVLQYDTSTFAQDFLIYNRAWAGTREYRLAFVDRLIQAGLVIHCRTSFAPVDSGLHYNQHKFENPNLTIVRTDLETVLQPNTHDSHASADYNNQDYAQTGMEIVLETLFDDSRLHLTEKALRPIACGKPFMLVATAGSLKYLRSYGFETFGNLIDESYDLESDPVARLNAVIREMTRIAAMNSLDKIVLWNQLHQIAERNKQRFFSAEWQASIVQEYVDNMNQALITMNQHCTGRMWLDSLEINLATGIASTRSQEEIDQVLNHLALKNSPGPGVG